MMMCFIVARGDVANDYTNHNPVLLVYGKREPGALNGIIGEGYGDFYAPVNFEGRVTVLGSGWCGSASPLGGSGRGQRVVDRSGAGGVRCGGWGGADGSARRPWQMWGRTGKSGDPQAEMPALRHSAEAGSGGGGVTGSGLRSLGHTLIVFAPECSTARKGRSGGPPCDGIPSDGFANAPGIGASAGR